MNNEPVTQVTKGVFEYRLFINRLGCTDAAGVGVFVSQAPHGFCQLGVQPNTLGFRFREKCLELYLSKVALGAAQEFAYHGDVTWFLPEPKSMSIAHSQHPRKVSLSERTSPTVDFSSANGLRLGNMFEVFHCPLVTKNPLDLLRSIYEGVVPEDDFALLFTDFRLDDLFSQGGGSFSNRASIQGIGPIDTTRDMPGRAGSKRLQLAVAPVWVGAPFFAESGTISDRQWFNSARGVWWIVHEFGHRWGMRLSFRDPASGNEEKLADDARHWSEGLNAISQIPVAKEYLNRPAPEHSPMGGAAWRENPDGTFSKSDLPHSIPGGFAALDLYAMGLLPAEQVPDTFLLKDLQDLGGNRYKATKVLVRIEDVVAALGPRVPSSDQSQKSFQLGLYLLHEAGREVDPAMHQRAGRLGDAVVEYYERATGSRLHMVPSRN